MLISNTNIWQTRVQNIDALLTAAGPGGTEVYYLATICQVGLDPPMVSISPNPEYPICAAIDAAGYFGVNFLAEGQGDLIARCIALPRDCADKLAALGLCHERTERGALLLLDCIQSLEVRVERAWDSGDHRTYLGPMITRRVREDFRRSRPHRFGGTTPVALRVLKRVLCETGVFDLLMTLKAPFQRPLSIEQGTQRYIPGAVQEISSSAAQPGGARLPGICLVGCGWWGGVHALALKRQAGRIRRYFVSRTIEHARDFARRFDGAAAFGSLEEALAAPGVDAVVVALPHHLHAEVAGQALAASKHVLVEKPIATTVAEGEKLVRQAESSGLCLAVAEEYRLSPLVQAAYRVMQQGLLGRITLVRASSIGTYRPTQAWKNARASMGGGVLIDVGVHYIDILRHWFGEPDWVCAVRPPQINDRLEGEDGIAVTLRFADGPVADLMVSWSGQRAPDAPQMEVIGERGALELRFHQPYLLHIAPLPAGHWAQRLRDILPWRIASRIDKFLPKAHRGRVAVDGHDLIGSQALIEDFVRAITQGKAPAVPGSEGLRDLRVVQAAYQSLESGRPVSLAN